MYSDDPWDPSKDTIDPGSCPDENDGDSIPERSVQPNFGHTKGWLEFGEYSLVNRKISGTLFFNKNSGVWLSHSVRYFPKTESYAYSKCGRQMHKISCAWRLTIPNSTILVNNCATIIPIYIRLTYQAILQQQIQILLR